MGCCTNFRHFCQTVGIAPLLCPQPCLYFLTPDGRQSRFQADPLPAPLHLARSFLRAHFLSGCDKVRIAWALACLGRPIRDDPPFLDWLRRHGQTPRTIERFWGLVLTSALNETPERIGLRYARKVFLDGFLRHPRGFQVELPSVPLGRLYGAELQQWLDRHQVQRNVHRAARRLRLSPAGVEGLELRHGEVLRADWYVCSVPFERLLDLVPEEVRQGQEYFRRLTNLECSPITSVHLWYDRPITDLPHAVLVGGVGQWLFRRAATGADHYVQVVVSAARPCRGRTTDDLQRQVVAELARLFPAARQAVLQRGRVVTEQAATFSAVPGVDAWRPGPRTPYRNLFVAGDWTATGWPATMEGAVRSGYLAAEALLRDVGRPERLVQPDLGRSSQ
jgi:squalene-associated FAD-dependent desaturase